MQLKIDDEDEESLTQEQKFFGLYPGYVRDTDDPDGLGRIRVYCPTVAGGPDDVDHWLPWAGGCFPLGAAKGSGSFLVPFAPRNFKREMERLSIMVYIQFVGGDPRYPVYLGGSYVKADKLGSFIPKNANPALGKDKSKEPPVGSSKTRLIDPETGKEQVAKEPKPRNLSRTPDNRVIRMPSGTTIEVDETENSERIKVFHKSGTYWEMTTSGLISKVQGKHRMTVTDSELTTIVGPSIHVHNSTRQLQVDGTNTELVKGAHKAFFGGDHLQKVLKNAEMIVSGLYLVDVADYVASSSSNFNMSAAEGITMAGREARILGAQAVEIAGLEARILSTKGVELCGTLQAPIGTGNILMGAEFGKAWLAAQAVYEAVSKGAGAAEVAVMPIMTAAMMTFMTTLAVKLNLPAPAGLLSLHRVSAI